MAEQEKAVRELMVENKDEATSIGRREPSNSGPKVLATVCYLCPLCFSFHKNDLFIEMPRSAKGALVLITSINEVLFILKR